MVRPHALLQVTLPPYAALGDPPVVSGHCLLNGPTKIARRDVGDKPRKGFAVKTDLAYQASVNQEVCQRQVGD